MRNVTVSVLILCQFLTCRIVIGQELWVGKDGNIRNADVRALTAGGDRMYLATRNEVYGLGVEHKWESIFALPAGDNEINCLAGRGYDLFVGTRQGLFRSNDQGRTWRKVFKTITPEKSDILWVEPLRTGRNSVIIGTGMGVFQSDDNGAKWQDVSGSLRNGRVFCLVCDQYGVYASSSSGIFARDEALEDWQRISVRSASTETSEAEDPAQAEIGEPEDAYISAIATAGSRLYTASGKKIQYSEDGGKGWIPVTDEGIVGDITSILPLDGKGSLCCSTTRGVFEYSAEKKRWVELYKGFEKTVEVRRIVLDRDNDKIIWAVTDNGVYKYEIGAFAPDGYVDVEMKAPDISIIYDNEPPFKDLQKAAMKFAEVDPDKIKNWRMQARLRALVPKVSFDIDNASSNTYEIYTSATKDYVVSGPEDITKGFDVSISWDLADMIWSDDQTNIDVRSRLTTQLRNDILDDLRRAYYERKRLQLELMSQPPKSVKARYEKELRIRELTQAIDDLTGNYLSDYMEKPEKANVSRR